MFMIIVMNLKYWCNEKLKYLFICYLSHHGDVYTGITLLYLKWKLNSSTHKTSWGWNPRKQTGGHHNIKHRWHQLPCYSTVQSRIQCTCIQYALILLVDVSFNVLCLTPIKVHLGRCLIQHAVPHLNKGSSWSTLPSQL